MGRPSLYTHEIANEICARLAAGESLNAICKDAHLPDEVTVRNWDRDNREGFSANYARARETQYWRHAEQIIEIADDGSNDWMERNDPKNPGFELNGEHVQRSKLRVDARKWVLSKLLPKTFGDKIDVTQNLGDGWYVAGEVEQTEAQWTAGHNLATAKPAGSAD